MLTYACALCPISVGILSGNPESDGASPASIVFLRLPRGLSRESLPAMNKMKKPATKPENNSSKVVQSSPQFGGLEVGLNPTVAAALQRALHFSEAGEPEKAADLLHTAGRHPAVRNALGVALMRMKRYGAAVDVLRDLALQPNCTFVRRDLPLSYKANFATALLLAGYINGCRDVLAEIHEESHPRVQQLRGALRDWEGTLSFWQRLNWRFGQIEPRQRVVTLKFTPGEMYEGEHAALHGGEGNAV